MIKIKDALELYNNMYGTEYKNINELGVSLARTTLKDLYLSKQVQDMKKAHETEELE